MRDRRPRLIVVRRGAVELFEELQARYRRDGRTTIIWDRRNAEGPNEESHRPPRERRFPRDRDILIDRGFFVTRTGNRRIEAG